MTNLESSTKALRNAVTDPVCRMDVNPGQTRLLAIYRGQTYWFCSKDCRTAFEMNPQKYLDTKRGKQKGWFRRYYERIAKVGREQFGSVGPQCH
jgi:YHS domain-containing protein